MPVERHDNSAVLFADITGSSQLYVDVGEQYCAVVVPLYRHSADLRVANWLLFLSQAPAADYA